MVYVYAVTEPETPLPDLSGLEKAPLRAIFDGGLAAVVSDLEAPVEPTEAALWKHEGVVEELMRHGPVMPMRFGSALPDDAAARSALREREQQLTEGLVRVRGAVELGVRALWDPADQTEPTSLLDTESRSETGAGTTYLMRRLGLTRRSRSLADQIHAPLAQMARLSTRRLLVTPRLLLSGAYLVEEGAVEDFRSCADRLDEYLEEAAIICTGPWPPYSFAPTEPVVGSVDSGAEA